MKSTRRSRSRRRFAPNTGVTNLSALWLGRTGKTTHRRELHRRSNLRVLLQGEDQLMHGWLADTGAPAPVEHAPNAPDQALIKQSCSRLGTETTNDDGFSLG